MKKILNSGILVVLFTNIFTFAYSQGESAVDDENYVKSNIAVTKFKLLGVNARQYVKCIETVNFFEADKKLRFLVIDNISFADNGLKYDLVADDGILTSTEVFTYAAGTRAIPTGMYQNTSGHDSFVFDESFAHYEKTGSFNKLIIGCKFKWVPCSQMTNPAQQFLCNWAGWPRGSFTISECEVKWEG